MILLSHRWQKCWQKYLVGICAIALTLWLVAGGGGIGQPAQAQAPAAPSLDQLRQQRDQLDQQLEVHSETDKRYQKAESRQTAAARHF